LEDRADRLPVAASSVEPPLPALVIVITSAAAGMELSWLSRLAESVRLGRGASTR
jgi:hypothetical protein